MLSIRLDVYIHPEHYLYETTVSNVVWRGGVSHGLSLTSADNTFLKRFVHCGRGRNEPRSTRNLIKIVGRNDG